MLRNGEATSRGLSQAYKGRVPEAYLWKYVYERGWLTEDGENS